MNWGSDILCIPHKPIIVLPRATLSDFDYFRIICLTKRWDKVMQLDHRRLLDISKNNPTTTYLRSIVFMRSGVWRTFHSPHAKFSFSLCFSVWNYGINGKLRAFIWPALLFPLPGTHRIMIRFYQCEKALRSYEPPYNIPANPFLELVSCFFIFSTGITLLPRQSLLWSTDIN